MENTNTKKESQEQQVIPTETNKTEVEVEDKKVEQVQEEKKLEKLKQITNAEVKPETNKIQIKETEESKEEKKPSQNRQEQEDSENEGGVDENEQNWTDATQSVAADEDIDIWMVDNDICQAMEIDSQEEAQLEKLQKEREGQEQEESDEGQQKKEEVDYEDLEDQFVTGGESEQTYKLADHGKFCISVAVTPDGKRILSGGGDDHLRCHNEVQPSIWKEFYSLKHTQTVSKVEVSHDGKYVVTLTDNEIYCTELAKQESLKLDIEQPSDVVCHKNGGVLAAAHEYSVSIYNLKGLQLYATYNLDVPPTNLIFAENGKQIVAACQNKLRIITPKTGDITKAAGNEFHKQEIAALNTNNQVVVTGCIAGEVFVTSLAKGNILGRMEPFKGTINVIFMAENHALIAPQSEGVHWTDINKLKTIFHSPANISASSIVKVHSPHHYAISDLDGNIHLLDYRAPMNIISTIKAGNTIHALTSKGSNLYAACEDGCVRVFDLTKTL